MNPVEPPVRLPAPPVGLGRLGEALAWLAQAQGAWPPRPPRHPRTLQLAAGNGLLPGVDEADALADSGVDLLVLEGPPATPAALVLLCALLDLEPVTAVGTAGGPDWAATVVAVRDALPGARSLLGEPARLVEDPLLGRAAGLLAQSAVRRTPVILGASPVLAAAALAAERIAPGARRWWLAGAQSTSTPVRLAYADLVLDPLLDLGLTGSGGATLAAGLIGAATELIAGPGSS